MCSGLCGSIVANPIIYRLVPSPSRFETRQWGGLWGSVSSSLFSIFLHALSHLPILDKSLFTGYRTPTYGHLVITATFCRGETPIHFPRRKIMAASPLIRATTATFWKSTIILSRLYGHSNQLCSSYLCVPGAYYRTGARFSKLPVITGPVKLFCFPFQMWTAKLLKIIQ